MHFLIPLKKIDRIDKLKNQGYEIIFDPSGDGSCQFSAAVYFLCSSGFDCSANQLCEEVVDYLKTHRKTEEVQPYELFAGIPWSSYLNEMRLNRTYGNHITLDASHASNIVIWPGSSSQRQPRKRTTDNDFGTLCRGELRPLCLLKIRTKF